MVMDKSVFDHISCTYLEFQNGFPFRMPHSQQVPALHSEGTIKDL